MKLLRALVLLLLVLGLSGCGYNAIQRQDEAVKAAWSEVINQYQRRADLVPNLVNTVKGYAQHEEKVLTEVTNARARVGTMQLSPDALNDPQKLQQFQQAQGQLSSALSRLMVVSENYPQLRPTACSRICRRSWKAPRTASPWRATATCSRCRRTTR